MSTREEAQAAYDAAAERHQAAQEDLLEARRELDRHLREESLERFAAYLAEPGAEPVDTETARSVMRLQEGGRA